MVCSAVFILDLKGKVLISRNYRGDVSMSCIEKFMPLIMEAEEDDQVPTPIISTGDGSIHFCYVKHNNLYCEFTFLLTFIEKALFANVLSSLKQ